MKSRISGKRIESRNSRPARQRSGADVLQAYVDQITSDVKPARGCGIAGRLGQRRRRHAGAEVYRALGCEVEELYCEVDGRFRITSGPVRCQKNLQELIQTVKSGKADGESLSTATAIVSAW